MIRAFGSAIGEMICTYTAYGNHIGGHLRFETKVFVLEQFGSYYHIL